MSGAASYLARRAAQREKVRILYRRALKDTLNWAVHCHLFYPDADALRERFDANKNVVSLLLVTQARGPFDSNRRMRLRPIQENG
ncbi:unnamed protein product [Lactuca virosa]|uniref:NADH dehydrogenase [ubiquinone] 1 beta subcomplex subunit 9 n=1 Tax=Lactuca virosa TaxID=75947 RepID=A0AAU9PNJ8_9ASTR|nr:unnamed protein product [Lactuca virosa]